MLAVIPFAHLLGKNAGELLNCALARAYARNSEHQPRHCARGRPLGHHPQAIAASRRA
jgi:hypothetical protein